jgi:hypothetical protein
MYYEVFPFGKYKGVKLTDLPSTYIVVALEQFELPKELMDELGRIIFGRFKVYSQFQELISNNSKKENIELLSLRKSKYEIK